MANNKTNYLEGKIIEHNLRNVAYTSPTTVYVSLHTADPTETGGLGAEIAVFAYARTAATFGAHSGGTCTNSVAVSFPAASGGNWGAITHFGINDASTAGNMLYYGPLDATVTINDTNQFVFAIGQLSVQEL